MPITETVYIVDDEISVRNSLSNLLESAGYETRSFAAPDDFMSSLDRQIQAGCLLLDMRIADVSGLDVQQQLSERERQLPIIFMTGYGTIPMTVQAIRAGAIEFLTKPLDDDLLLQAVRTAIDRDKQGLDARMEIAALRIKYETLTAREKEVFALVIGGLMNKQVAAELGTSDVTAKVHRGRVMDKMDARSVAELVSQASFLDIRPAKMR